MVTEQIESALSIRRYHVMSIKENVHVILIQPSIELCKKKCKNVFTVVKKGDIKVRWCFSISEQVLVRPEIPRMLGNEA